MPTSAEVSWAELQVADTALAGEVSWAELVVPDPVYSIDADTNRDGQVVDEPQDHEEDFTNDFGAIVLVNSDDDDNDNGLDWFDTQIRNDDGEKDLAEIKVGKLDVDPMPAGWTVRPVRFMCWSKTRSCGFRMSPRSLRQRRCARTPICGIKTSIGVREAPTGGSPPRRRF